ncbi:unnamed protein product, partial [Ectocarpus fasciculatus]
TGRIPPQLGDLGTLKNLRLSGNNLEGELNRSESVSFFFRVLNMHESRLCIGRTHILEGGELLFFYPAEFVFARSPAGPIPAELGKLAALERLHLQRNRLSGAIPAQLGALNSVTWLDLSHNQL